MRARLFVVPLAIFVASFLLAACSSDEPSATPVSDEPLSEEAYLSAITSAEGLVADRIERLATTLGPLFPRTASISIQKAVVFSEFEELEIGKFFEERYTAAAALVPSPGYAEDHQRYVASLQRLSAMVPVFESAIEDDDFAVLHLTIAEFQEESALTAIASSSSFCRALFRGAGVPDDVPPLCPENDDLPGGAYGQEISSLSHNFIARFGPRAGTNAAMT
jgi:hypothetical protein